ncbi:hypothetical protein [Sphingomonas sp. NFR15]|uniref:DUF6953 family protein n=1 Tax=Sphingomonas sp. NFR15 TaxID=1566282 RepID=UPI0011600432|nr:hypothetical protein [Sphingomonas sp. NFR15]
MTPSYEDVPARRVAEYLVTLIPPGHGRLTQSRASAMIRKKFGLSYVQKNKNGNWGIRADVLKAFNALTSAEPNDLVWMMSSQIWRRRQPTDAPGRLAKRMKSVT